MSVKTTEDKTRLTTSIDSLEFDAIGADTFFRNVVNTKVHGYLMFLHDPYELPSKLSQQIDINMDHDFNIFVDPQINAIDDSLIDFEPHERNCYLDDEHKLKFFKVYTRINCEAECLTNFMISRCDCVEFFMIQNSTTRICSASEKRCFDKARNSFEDYRSSCKCLQPCDYVNYYLTIDSKKRHRTVFYKNCIRYQI
ncbi:hypothetical protein PVAND_005120 [Polypedilum vanderplanki]|uniref:Uncharacterized protein n=1 Tax=Polypedilum vanderplanki TaxID=319348 RepID=A0A9J6BZ76_POLVA|nr:hypothetical protein PVAND_005120 [Polypedilum vanderplanki]